MAQFHVYRLPDGRLILDLQTDLIDTGSRVVAPLIPQSEGPTPISRLEPILPVDGAPCILHAAEMAAVPSRFVQGDPVANLTPFDYDIRRALDMVFSGF